MSPGTNREVTLLRRLARLYGIQPDYVDMEKKRVQASPDALMAALAGLGASVESMVGIEAAIEERRRQTWSWRLEPVVVAWEGSGNAILRLPAEDSHHRMDAAIRLEDGQTRSWGVNLTDVPPLAVEEVGGEAFVAKSLPLPHLPHGYHTLALDVLGRHREATVISAPRKAFERPGGPSWGLFLPVYALRPRQGEPIAGYDDLQRFIAFVGDQGGAMAGTLPLLPAFLDEPFDPSPYSPVSRLFWNELYVTTKAAVTDAHARSASERVEYGGAMARKRREIEAEARALTVRESADLERFLEQKPGVRDYATFRAAAEHLGPDWRGWRASARSGRLTPEDCDEETVRFYVYAQWRAHQQVQATRALARERRVELYLDLPVGVHPDGYDAWRHQGVFVEGMSIGAPPDIVTTSGQDWGSRPLHPERLRESGYRYVIDYLRHQFSAASVLRIDHAMGLHRLYWVPRGAGARDGLYIRYQPEEQYAILCLESQRQQTAIVGENLGIVPDAINRSLSKHGIGRMFVLSIELTGDAAAPHRRIPRTVVASFGTHDLPTFAAFWRGTDTADRLRLGVLSPERARIETREREKQKAAIVAHLRQEGLLSVEEQADVAAIYRGVVALLGRSRARRVLLNLEDLWQETEPQNLPGTTQEQYPNWSHQADYDLSEVAHLPAANAVLELMRRLRPAPGR